MRGSTDGGVVCGKANISSSLGKRVDASSGERVGPPLFCAGLIQKAVVALMLHRSDPPWKWDEVRDRLVRQTGLNDLRGGVCSPPFLMSVSTDGGMVCNGASIKEHHP